MNIWILNHYALPPGISGGTRHYDISRELVKKGHSVTIIASSFHYSILSDFKTYKDSFFIAEKIHSVNFVWIKTIPYAGNGFDRLRNMLSYNRGVKRYLKKSKPPPPEIIIGSSVHLFAVNLAFRLSKKYKARFWAEVRDFWPHTLVLIGQMKKHHPIVFLFKSMEKRLYKKAEKIITLFPKGHHYLERFVPRQKILYLPNSFNTEILNNLPEKTFFDPEKFNITYAGTIGLANDVETFVKAAEHINNNNIVFHIIGEGKEKEKIQVMVAKKQLSNVTLHSSMPKKDLISVLRQADVLWAGMKNSKLYQYGFSFNKLYDYMASKRPVILSSAEKNNIIEDAGCGTTIAPENSEKLAEAILQFYNMSKEQLHMTGTKGFEFLMKHLTTKIIAEKLLNEIDK